LVYVLQSSSFFQFITLAIVGRNEDSKTFQIPDVLRADGFEPVEDLFGIVD